MHSVLISLFIIACDVKYVTLYFQSHIYIYIFICIVFGWSRHSLFWHSNEEIYNFESNNFFLLIHIVYIHLLRVMEAFARHCNSIILCKFHFFFFLIFVFGLGSLTYVIPDHGFLVFSIDPDDSERKILPSLFLVWGFFF